MFLADVENRLDVEIDDNEANFYEMPNTSDDSKENENHLKALKGCLSCSEEELEEFCRLSLRRGHYIPNKVLILKNAKWLSFTFKNYDADSNQGKVHYSLVHKLKY